MNTWGILFDFGGVLSVTQGSRKVLATHSEPWALDVESLIQQLFSGPVWEQASRGEISPARYWAHVSRKFPPELAKVLHPFADDPFFGENLDPAVLALLKAVRTRGHRTALCSNALPGLIHHLSQYPALMAGFDVIIISALVGSRKPEETIYRLAVEHLKLPPERCLLIDDRERNTRAAEALGLHAIVHVNAHQTLRALQALDVLPYSFQLDEEAEDIRREYNLDIQV